MFAFHEGEEIGPKMLARIAKHTGGARFIVLVLLGMSANARSWVNLQSDYDLRIAEIENGKRIEREIVPTAAIS